MEKRCVDLQPGPYAQPSYIVPCAHCGGVNTHHAGIDIHARNKEDAPTVSTRVYDKPFNGESAAKTDNPSSRRDGLCVVLECEACDGQTSLAIEQHKGETYLRVMAL